MNRLFHIALIIVLEIALQANGAAADILTGKSSLERIDIAKTPAGEPAAVPQTDWTVAAWYFAAWEREYNWGGWEMVAKTCPWRIPILFDSADPHMNWGGIQYYANGNRRVIDWHVKWMREHCINLMLWDWYPTESKEGVPEAEREKNFNPGFFGNRALEEGFLGKEKLGGPPVATNRFAETMPFAVMWTNHWPFYAPVEATARYTCRNFFNQPNYYRIDGKPLLVVMSHHHIALELKQSGEDLPAAEERTVEYLSRLRQICAEEGYPEIYITTCVNEVAGARHAKVRGYDGLIHYNIFELGGSRHIEHTKGNEKWTEVREEYATQTVPGFERMWGEFADVYGKDYLLATMPMQDFRPTERPVSYYFSGTSPEAYRPMLQAAKRTVEARGMRRFVTIEAWNEWWEGSYIEPSTEWGMEWLEVIRDEFATKANKPE